MNLRFATEADLNEITTIEMENFSEEEQLTPSVLRGYIIDEARISLVITDEENICAYLLCRACQTLGVTDALYDVATTTKSSGPYLAIASLSIQNSYQKQGLGTLLLAGLKEVAAQNGYTGICLACHEELISYYEMNGFTLLGVSKSQFAGELWYDMYWESL